MKKLLIILAITSLLSAQEIIRDGNSFYLSNTLIVKFKENPSPNFNIQELFSSRKNNTINSTVISFKKLYEDNPNILFKGSNSLANIYSIEIITSEDIRSVAQKISSFKNVEYAEPRYIHKLAYVPSDSLYKNGSQDHLNRIFAEDAWNITKGDSSVLIAIIDTGVDWGHPDLAANILKDINGKVIGKDFGGTNGIADDDPIEDIDLNNPLAFHGTHVAGIASAVTDNKIGVASIGYNCTILPVKVSRSDRRDDRGYPYVYYGYEGIKYAADNGARIINCSWGGYSYSRYEQDIINYAASLGAVVVAASGNDNLPDTFYPAGYENVLSVGWLNYFSDQKFPNGNYGKDVDVMAPGTFILSTWQRIPDNETMYRSISGSSMASPLVAGLAGLVAAQFPNYSPEQIIQRIRATADDIYSANEANLKYLLGKGRVNAFKAVAQTNVVAVKGSDIKFIERGNNNGIFETNESVEVAVSIKNYFEQINNLSITVETDDPYINLSLLTNSNFSLDASREYPNLYTFKFDILPTAPTNHTINFLIHYKSIGYEDYQWITARINPTYDNHNNNKITMTVTSKGTLAYNDFPNNLEGEGFKYNNNDNVMFEGAFMYGTGKNNLMDAARSGQSQSFDFLSLQQYKVVTPGKIADQEGFTMFNDSEAKTASLGITTEMTTYSFQNPPDDNYVIIKTRLKNETDQVINNIYAGYFVDWDIPFSNSNDDTTGYDRTNNFAFAFDKGLVDDPNYYGSALLSDLNYSYYPLLTDGSAGEIIMINGFEDLEKFTALSSGIKFSGGVGGDVSYVMGGGPFSISPKSYKDVAFVFAGAESMDNLRNTIIQSRKKYIEVITGVIEDVELPTEFTLFQNYPNPFNPQTTISYVIPNGMPASNVHVTLKVYDILGREVATLVNEIQQAGIHNYKFSIINSQLSSAVYFYRLHAGDFVSVKKMILMK
ncbi:MAG: S8 family peptidase [Melioribacteraceae bacterium]|nr:S8 family peptidase [Melioribacteraceae bacterium]